MDGTRHPDGPTPAALLSGSFNPLHRGHLGLAAAAEDLLGAPVVFELSVRNVDKAAMGVAELRRRLGQFAGVRPVWVTDAPTFDEKSALFPGVTFVVGFDTAARLLDPKYHRDDPAERDALLGRLGERACQLLVAGRRAADGTFLPAESLAVPAGFGGLFRFLSEAAFRMDVSSTELRPGGR